MAAAIQNRWDEHLRLRREGAAYSSCVRLGEIENCVQFANLSGGLALKWSNALEGVALPSSLIQAVRDEAKGNVQRLNRILNAPGSLVDEEMLLVVTMRVELEMLFTYFSGRGMDGLPDTSLLDEALVHAVRAPDNAATFLAAQKSARKNWGLPLRSKWLGTESTAVETH